MSEKLGQYMTKGEKERKDPVEMVNIELLEIYSHYNRIYLRPLEEQDYTALLRNEMFKRMGFTRE